MKKNAKMMFAMILLVAFVLPITYSYATTKLDPIKKEKQFFEIAKLEVAKSEKVEMDLNLDMIKYKEFRFELQSNEVIKDVEMNENKNLIVEKNDNEIVMEINKENTNVKTITLFYEIPENKKVGDTIKFVATITKMEDEVKVQDTNIESIDKQPKKEDQTTQKQVETQIIEFEVKIIEEKTENSQREEPNFEDNKQETANFQAFDKNNKSLVINEKTTTQTIPTNYATIPYSGNSSSEVQKVTYYGSNNNYLRELLVEGYCLNNDFSKENSTYFITVGNEVEMLTISAIVEDDTADVCIYGNETLKSGTNKFLISVTAENGNVRNYRIYVTKNG